MFKTIFGEILNEYKLFVKQIGIVGVTHILVALSGIILLPIITKSLSISDYGVWIQVNTTIILISLLGTFGLPYTMIRFLAAEKNKEKIQDAFYSIILFIVLISTMLGFIIFIFSKEISSILFDGNTTVGILIPVIIILSCLNIALINFFRAFQQIKRFSVFTILQTYINVGLVGYLVISGYGINGAVNGILITQVILFLMMIILITAQIGFKIPKFNNFKEFLSFGIPTVPGNLSQWIVDSSDRYVIGLLLGVVFTGFYAPGYTIGNITYMISYPLALILPAFLSNYYDNNDIIKVKTILNYSLKYYLAVAIPSTFVLSLLSNEILLILTTPEIAFNGYLVTPFVALGGLFFGSYSIVVQSIILKKKTKIIGLIWIMMAFFNFGLNIIFVPYFGIEGAAAITMLTYISTFVITSFYSFKFLKFEIDLHFLFKTIISSLLISSIIIVSDPVGIINIITICLISIIIYIFCMIILGINKKEIDFILDLFKKV